MHSTDKGKSLTVYHNNLLCPLRIVIIKKSHYLQQDGVITTSRNNYNEGEGKVYTHRSNSFDEWPVIMFLNADICKINDNDDGFNQVSPSLQKHDEATSPFVPIHVL